MKHTADFEGSPEAIQELTTEAETLLRDNPEGLVGDDVTAFEGIETQIERHRQIARIRELALDPRNVIRGDLPPNEPIIGVHNTDPWQSTRHGNTGSIPETRSRALSAVELMPELTDAGSEAVTRMIERDGNSGIAEWALVSSDPHYRTAFGKLLTDPMNGHRTFTPDELGSFQRAETLKRAMAIGSGGTGGFMVPTHLDASVILSNTGVADPVRSLATVSTIGSSTWNGITSAGVSAQWKSEAAEAADASPTLVQPSIPVHFADAFVPVSYEVLGDTDIAQEVGALMADAKSRLEAVAWIDGTGSGQPTGLVKSLDGGASEVAPAVAETFAADDVYTMLEALPPRHRNNASWLMGLPTINTIARFWNPSGSEPPLIDRNLLLRKPFFEASSMGDTSDIDAAATADNFILLCGDFREYRIVDRVGSTLEHIPQLFHTGANRPSGQRGFMYWWRTGADTTHIDAFRLLNIATAA